MLTYNTIFPENLLEFHSNQPKRYTKETLGGKYQMFIAFSSWRDLDTTLLSERLDL